MWKISTDTDFPLVKSRVRRWLWKQQMTLSASSELLLLTHDALSGTLYMKLNQNCIMHCMCKCVFSQNARSFGDADDLLFLTGAFPTWALCLTSGVWWPWQPQHSSLTFSQEMEWLWFQWYCIKYKCVTSGMQKDCCFAEWLFVDIQEAKRNRYLPYFKQRDEI